jgi:hypothetical protein
LIFFVTYAFFKMFNPILFTMKKQILLLTAVALLSASYVGAQTAFPDGRNNGNSQGLILVTQPLVPANPYSQPVSDQDNPAKDNVISDDQVVIGGLGVGTDMYDGYNFAFKTIALRANNTRIYFDDSSLPGFPNTDWCLEANSSTSGGESHFAILDSTNATVPFKVVAAAPTNSLVIQATTGNLGVKTANPEKAIHVVRGDTPAIRLDQDNSSGWTPQVWDLAGNESNFFIRDVTNSSSLPFRIQPGAPSNCVAISSSGNVGIGTYTPAEKLDINGSMKLAAITTVPASPAEGSLYMDGNDHLLKYYNGTLWATLSTDTDDQSLTAATLTGSILQIDIENGSSVSVDLAPLLADLEARVTALENAIGTKEYTSGKATLLQNSPNPFTGETSISFLIPADVKKARLVITNVKGIVVKEYPINGRGQGVLQIKDADLQAGTYFYSLTLDGQHSESKILIKVE